MTATTPPPADDLDALLTLVAELDAEEQAIAADLRHHEQALFDARARAERDRGRISDERAKLEARIRAARRAQRFAGAGAKRGTRPRATRGTT